MIKIGVSACLLGQEVRYDGGHKKDSYITDILSKEFEFVALCPEVAIGLSIPRPPIHLVDKDNEIHVMGVQDRTVDVTDDLKKYADEAMSENNDIDGYIFKSRSPSCALKGLALHDVSGQAIDSNGLMGVFAEKIIQRHPNLPVIDEVDLKDAKLCRDFINKVHKHHELRKR